MRKRVSKQEKEAAPFKKTAKTSVSPEKKSIQRSLQSGRPTLLPPALAQFLYKAFRCFAAFICLLGVLLAVAALVGYNGQDPSLNNSHVGPVHNPLGAGGAAFADILLQTLGFGAYLLWVGPFIWSFKAMRLRSTPHFWLHLAAIPLGVTGGAMLLAALPDLSDLTPVLEPPVAAGYGGALGERFYGIFLSFSLSLWQGPSWAPLSLMTGVYTGFIVLIGLPVYGFSFGLEPSEWRAFGRVFFFVFSRIILWPIRGVSWFFVKAYALYRYRSREKGQHSDTVSGFVKTEEGSGDKNAREKDEEIESNLNLGLGRKKERPPVAAPKAPKKGSREGLENQPVLPLSLDGYILPTLDLLQAPPQTQGFDKLSTEALEQNALLLLSVLEDFGVRGEIREVRPGPVVTLYELEPAAGTKSSRVIGLADDIARSMSAISARVAVVPGRNRIGIELPNTRRETVYLRELLASNDYERSRARLGLVLGKDIGGAPVVADLASMPHLLVAGTTGSGKSVGINTMILSLLYKHSPETLKLIMVDPKMLELSIYDGIPHLLSPVVTDAKKAVVALKWAVREMEERYAKMSKLRVRNLAAFNKRVSEAKAKDETLKSLVQTGYDKESGEPVFEEEILNYDPLPSIVIIIDEMADLMIVAGKDVEATVQRLAQMARAAGLHVIMATQRPSVDVITGTIKANFPTRISFQVTSKIDSRTILNEQGAEQLLGQGDMLYMAGGGRITRVHGAFVDDDEVEAVVAHLRRQGAPAYIQAVTEEPDGGFDSPYLPAGAGAENNEQSLYDQAVDIVQRDRRASTSYIQRRLSIGYNRAATLIEEMEKQGVISAPNHKGQREVLTPEREDEYL